MSFEVGHIAELKFEMSFLGQVLLNVFHFKILQSGTPENFEVQLNEYSNQLITQMKAVQSSDLTFISQTWYDLTDDIGYQQSLFTDSGSDITGDNCPSSTAIGMRKAVDSRITRPGSLRIGGLREGVISGNDIDPTYAGLFATLGVWLANRWESSDAVPADQLWLDMVVVGRTLGLIDLSKINTILNVGNARVTTQTTRRH